MVQFVGFGVGLAVCMLLDDQYISGDTGLVYTL